MTNEEIEELDGWQRATRRTLERELANERAKFESCDRARAAAEEQVRHLRDVCTRLQRDRNELAATLAFVRDDYTDTLHMTDDAIAMRGRLALVDGLRMLLAETQAELATVLAMRGTT